MVRVRLSVRFRRGKRLAEKMSRIREETEGYPSLTEALEEAREEEDKRLVSVEQ